MLHTNLHVNRSTGSGEEEDFESYMSVVAIFVM